MNDRDDSKLDGKYASNEKTSSIMSFMNRNYNRVFQLVETI